MNFPSKAMPRFEQPIATTHCLRTWAAFMTYDWPGNIRELQNAIERAVIMSDDGVLPNPLPRPGARPVVTVAATTLKEADRALILNTLDSVRWVVGGPKGAASKLGLNRSTLIAKMRRLGISRPTAGRPVNDEFAQNS
jgi:formate hydrogenlyase transcriptional activator